MSNRTTRVTNKSTKSNFMSFDEVAAIIQSGDSKKLRAIIKGGRVSDINMLGGNRHSTSLLMVACTCGSIECARVLLDHDANINFHTKSMSVLKSACISGNVDILILLIEFGVIVNDNIIFKLILYIYNIY